VSTARRHAWAQVTARHGTLPGVRLADKVLEGVTRIRLDATVVPAHSEKELAEANFKGFGHHPLLASCDNTGGEPLAWMLRRGSAGSNTAADHIALADTAIAALPPVFRRRLMITTDGAGASHDLIAHLDKLAARRGYQPTYSAGWALTGREKAALRLVPEQAWQAAIDPAARSASAAPMTPAATASARTGPAGYEAHGQPPATPRAWHRHFPPSRGPRGPEEAPDLAYHQEWTMGMQRPNTPAVDRDLAGRRGAQWPG
jgi:hypothetical protein